MPSLEAIKAEKARRRASKALDDHLEFIRLIYPSVEGSEFIVAPHDAPMARAVDDVISGRVKRLIVSVPPGYKKTITFVVMLIARGLAVNPAARFIHASYSDALVQENSSKIRDAVTSEEFQAHWNVVLRADTNAKGLWRTDQGGGLLAKSAGGTITGFRAGTLGEGFTGAMIIDDPLKPDDALTAERKKINARWHTTFKSRLAHEDVPVIVIMQRLHTDDFAGMLLKGGADGQEWDHLLLPLEIDNAIPYPSEYTHGIEYLHGLDDGPLWSRKHDRVAIEQLKLEPYTYAAQYAQRPNPTGGAIFKEDYLHRYRPNELPNLRYRKIWADTAQKTGQRNDYTVFQLWGAGDDGKAYLLDQVRGKWEAPELLAVAQAFYLKHKQVAHPAQGTLRGMAIEDKSSGTGLIQQLRREQVPVPVMAIARNKGQDKYSRALDVVPFFASGMVRIPMADAHSWITDYVNELLGFDGQGNAHDDQVDPTMDAVSQICGRTGSMLDVV